MAYTDKDFKTKKALKEAVAAYNELVKAGDPKADSKAVRCYQPGMGPDVSNLTGKTTLEGPHFPKPHTWYASATLEGGKVVKVS